ncbi:prenyltransferase/squalene oxidase repeat-containing protein [Candidatus Enterococcus ferrettii]|uniref:Prenyltransferase alpha-alpha toroid domain-containing protein n=1 Tax=Candidatus Enterococcus ferrettii TaxID=2815324 RepID=A0ABV0EQ79_9ENTE|nr:hypothetical protein [Enterococcus sp. 665A]MBO1339286.1 hypothetical protein [Enterococcus sp. 665A]
MESFSKWLSKQDICVQYIYENLLNKKSDLKKQERIATEGYGKYLLSQQNYDGHWGKYYYQPKWTSTHYTLLQLKHFGISPSCSPCREMVVRMFEECQLPAGGLNLAKSDMDSDCCVDGMILNYASYFVPTSEKLLSLVQSILESQKADGGFTWLSCQEGDPHTTICVLEGLYSFLTNTDYDNFQTEIEQTIKKGLQYFYQHKLFLAERKYLKSAYPFRYFYSVPRFLLLAADLNLVDNESIAKGRKLLAEKEYKGQSFFNFSRVGEIDPFLTVYGRYILAR